MTGQVGYVGLVGWVGLVGRGGCSWLVVFVCWLVGWMNGLMICVMAFDYHNERFHHQMWLRCDCRLGYGPQQTFSF